jgi:hypothetical protein
VTDRPGDWSERYDAILDEVEAQGDVVVLGLDPGDSGVWAAATDRIIAEALAIARELGAGVSALVAWNGCPRGAGDSTEYFLNDVRRRGMAITEISTLPSSRSLASGFDLAG